MATTSQAFPTAIEAFSSDERVYQALETGEWRLEDENGVDWEFVPSNSAPRTGTWRKTADRDEEARNAAKFQAQYWKPEVEESVAAAQNERKRRAEEAEREETAKKQRQQAENRSASKAIYVTGLPLDTDDMEIYNVFSRAGLIDESWDTNKPRIKMYYDQNNEFKGEALIVYWKADSVGRSMYMFHNTDFRAGPDTPGELNVDVADSAYKAHDTTGASDEPLEQRIKQKRKPLTEKDKQKIKNKHIEMDKKLSWDFDDEDTAPDQSNKSRWERMLVFKNMFTPQKLVDDPELYGDLKSDLKMMCEKFGEITNMVIYNAEPEGVATVRFATIEAAEQCQQKVNGKVYDDMPVKVFHSTGMEKFKKKAGVAKKEAEVAKPKTDLANE